MGLSRLLASMEGKKKSAKVLLEEKQMKRYFRSIKRSRGKSRPDYTNSVENTKNDNDKSSNKHIKEKPKNVVVKEKKASESSLTENQRHPKNSKEQPNPLADIKQPINSESADDLDSWEIIEWSPEDTNGDHTNDTDLSKEQCEPLKEKMISLESAQSCKTKSDKLLHNKTKILEEHKEKEKSCPDSVKNVPEYSATLFWRDPIPDLSPVDIESINHIDNKKQVVETFKPQNKSKALPKESDLLEHVWLNKHRYEDAETRYYEQLAR